MSDRLDPDSDYQYDPTNRPAGDHDEVVHCDHCDESFEDGTGHRLGSDYVCTACYYSHPVIIGELAAQLAADERSGK